MNTWKKGFTLIELLAVIIVIAIVALIAVPTISNIIETSRKGTFLRSAEGIRKISSNYYISNSSKFSNNQNLKFDCDNGRCKSIFVNKSGESEILDLGALGTVGDGYVKIYNNGNVEFLLSNGKYCAFKYPINEKIIVHKGVCETIDLSDIIIKFDTINISTTTNSITLNISVIATNKIAAYQFYINGKWTEIIDSNDSNYQYTFNDLIKDNYEIKVRVYDETYKIDGVISEINMIESDTLFVTLNDFENITITTSSTDWKTSKTYAITSTDEVAQLQYKIELGNEIKQDWTNYNSNVTVNWQSTLSVPTNICARLYDGTNTSEEICYTETKIDTTAPILTLGIPITMTNNVIVPIVTSDEESGIKNISCVYGTSTNYDKIGTISNNNCIISSIKNNTVYYYRVTALNNAGKSITKDGSVKTNDFENITITTSSTDWKTSKTYAITSTDAVAQLQYKIELGNEIKQDWTNYNSNVTVNWQSTLSVPTNICARLYDGTNTSEEICYTETKIDTTVPTLSVVYKTADGNEYVSDKLTNQSVTAYLTGVDNESGIDHYQMTYNGSDFIDIYDNKFTFDNSIRTGMWFRAIDKVGNIGTLTPTHLVSIDKIDPTVSYSVAGGTYNIYQTVRIIPSDGNYSYMRISVYKNSALVYSGMVEEKSTNKTSDPYYDVTLDSDGAWTIYTQVYDKAGNMQNQNPNNGSWYYQTYTIDTGGSYELAGYKWHVIWEDGEKIALLLDGKQLVQTKCDRYGNNCEQRPLIMDFSEQSWENSSINNFLNTTFLSKLIANGLNESKLYTSKICNTSFTLSSQWTSKGYGYLKDELDRDSVEGTCEAGTYTDSKVRLLSYVEAYNIIAQQDGKELIPGNPYIEKLNSDKIGSWFFNEQYDINSRYTMSAGTLIPEYYAGIYNKLIGNSIYQPFHGIYQSTIGVIVRPVIVIYK